MPARQYSVEIASQQRALRVPRRRLADAVRSVLRGERVSSAVISVAVVDDATIHDLNRRYLKHDYATDVLSFVLERTSKYLEGEVIVSAETAQRMAVQFGWTVQAELLLYVIHGVLHLVGHDDHSSEQRAAMRECETHYLEIAGIQRSVESSARMTTPIARMTTRKMTARQTNSKRRATISDRRKRSKRQ